MKLRALAPGFAVAPVALGAGDMAGLAAAGTRLVLNNRPEAEERGQPEGAAIASAAAAAGLAYRAIPVVGMPDAAAIAAMGEALALPGPAVAFCKSGTRSTLLWAAAHAAAGADVAEVIAAARAAGYDLGGLAGWLASLRR